jgi:hypothetical protein
MDWKFWVTIDLLDGWKTIFYWYGGWESSFMILNWVVQSVGKESSWNRSTLFYYFKVFKQIKYNNKYEQINLINKYL